ncbi:MAG: T9SS type A sorting domain-containing protein [Chitinophagaceae bacterium]|nr:T9SS type A sorting domain-containing protein [Chitinophagaceae bacterium]
MKKNYKSFSRLVTAGMLSILAVTTFANEYPVVNTNNTGAGSLNNALVLANTNPGLDTVTFNLPEGGSMTIAPTTALPAITDAVFINGYSQPGTAVGNIASRIIRVNIDGVGLPIITSIFVVNTTGVTIAGLAIYRSPQFSSGINVLNGATAFIWGNYIGTDSTGLSTGLGNAAGGIAINANSGVANAASIIGINGDGDNDAGEGNLISCNAFDGVLIWNTVGSTVAGNLIGFNKNGTGTTFGNTRNGLIVTRFSTDNVIGTNGDALSDNLEGNRIGNNGAVGVFLASLSDQNIIAGNVIGLDASNAAAGNAGGGIEINPGSNNRIGTNADGTSDAFERNTICANGSHGIRIVGGNFFGDIGNSNGNIIAGNAIGTNGSGVLVAGNTGIGIVLETNNNQSANNNIIGTNDDGLGDDIEGNIIANNSKGIVITTPAGTSTMVGNRISRNSIYDNTQLGIDHDNDGITANDNGDVDAGANELFNFPFITKSSVSGAGNLIITGIAPAGSQLEFFVADASGLEGRTFLFTALEGGGIDDSTGTGSFSDVTYGTGTDQRFGFTIAIATLPFAVTPGTVIVATAINTAATVGSTSEFGPAFISTLPVRLSQFNGKMNNGTVKLDWKTADESGNSHFDVERSNTGSTFDKIGTVKALGGVNNEYVFNDTKPMAGANFYRLKQVDVSGLAAYSKTLMIRSDFNDVKAKVSPNPFRGTLNVSFQLSKAETLSVRLYNQTGQLVKQLTSKGTVGINTINMGDLNQFAAGNYTLEVRGETVNHKQQVVKQ